VRLRADARLLPGSVIDDLKHAFVTHPGPSDVVLALETSEGPRFLVFGPEFRVDPTPSLRAELEHILRTAAGPARPAPLEQEDAEDEQPAEALAV
jgi:DNA polymerase-3 subunit alpha